MISRRLLLGTLVAASVVPMPRPGFAQGQSRAAKIQAKDGTSLYVKDTGGTGRAVVMTHAWPLNADIWDYQAVELAKAGFRVITYDRRGFGRSDQPVAGYTFDVFTDDLAAVIEQTGVRDATIVGYSMGGGEVVRYFSRHKARNAVKAALVGGAAYYLLKTDNNPLGIDGAVFDGIKQGVLGDRKTYIADLLANVFFDVKRPATNPATPEVINRALAMAMQASPTATAACVDAFSKTDFRPELASVSVPTVVFHGTADIPVPFALGKATANGIRQSKLIEYPDASHGIVLTERDRVARDLREFIAS